MAERRQGSYSFLKKSFKRLRFCAKIASRVFSFSFYFLKKCIEENRGCSRGMVYPKKKKKLAMNLISIKGSRLTLVNKCRLIHLGYNKKKIKLHDI